MSENQESSENQDSVSEDQDKESVKISNQGVYYKPLSEMKPEDYTDAQKELLEKVKKNLPKELTHFVTGFLLGSKFNERILVETRNPGSSDSPTDKNGKNKEQHTDKRRQSKGTSTLKKDGNKVRLHIHGPTIRDR